MSCEKLSSDMMHRSMPSSKAVSIGKFMVLFRSIVLAFAVTALSGYTLAADIDFGGHWTIDLRSPQERKQMIECGVAEFALKQVGDKIVGTHSFSTPGCGRLNEGGHDTVKGIVINQTAVLVVTSGRNGGMVLGKATRQGNQLHWKTVEELKAGEVEGDSPLILEKGTLLRDNRQTQK